MKDMVIYQEHADRKELEHLHKDTEIMSHTNRRSFHLVDRGESDQNKD